MLWASAIASNDSVFLKIMKHGALSYIRVGAQRKIYFWTVFLWVITAFYNMDQV